MRWSPEPLPSCWLFVSLQTLHLWLQGAHRQGLVQPRGNEDSDHDDGGGAAGADSGSSLKLERSHLRQMKGCPRSQWGEYLGGDFFTFLYDANNRLVMTAKPFYSFQLSLCDCLCESLIVIVTKMASLRGRTFGVVVGSATVRDDGCGVQGSPLVPWAHPLLRHPGPGRANPATRGRSRSQHPGSCRPGAGGRGLAVSY